MFLERSTYSTVCGEEERVSLTYGQPAAGSARPGRYSRVATQLINELVNLHSLADHLPLQAAKINTTSQTNIRTLTLATLSALCMYMVIMSYHHIVIIVIIIMLSMYIAFFYFWRRCFPRLIEG